MALIFVPVMSQRLVAKQSQFKPEMEEFRKRMEDARAEGNNQQSKLIIYLFRCYIPLFSSANDFIGTKNFYERKGY